MGKRDRGKNSTFFDYSEDELTFAKAIQRYKEKNHRPFPTYSEILEIAISLGYRKIKDESESIRPLIVDNK